MKIELPQHESTLSPEDRKALWKAVTALETQGFIARITDITGEPITKLLKSLPGSVTFGINSAVQVALRKALEAALYKLDSRLPEPGRLGYKVMSGVTGGLSGFFGLATLAVELPLTTTMMLRSIANIAREHGEDLSLRGPQLACLEVFALGAGDRGKGPTAETSYFAIRAFLARTVSKATEALAERGIARTSAPVIVELISAIGSRFGIVVSEKVAAGAIPVVGAIGGATVNLAFMEHFQKLAHAHFAIRRLERLHGQAEVFRLYEAYAPLIKEKAASQKKQKSV
jgi:hypothetical protein